MNIKNPNQTIIVYSNPKTGEYEFQLPQGDYQITYEGDGGEKVVRKVDLPLSNPSDSFALPGTILPKTDFVAELNVESNKTISVTKGDSILFPMKVEPKSILTIEHWVGDSLVSVEHYTILDSTFNYKMAPSRGKNRVVFKLTDRFNNTTKTEVLITREKNITNQPIISPEYDRVISQKQIASLAAMLKNRAKDNLLKVITEANIENKEFGKVDEYISYLKEEAGKKGVSPEDVDKLALKVAVMDNILTQAAVDLLAKHTDGDLKKLLSDLDIYKLNLRTWTDLQEYINAKTGGKISPEDLNRIAAAVLAETDPSIALLRSKILAFSENSVSGDLIRQTVAVLDQSSIKTKEKWLQAFYDEAIKHGLTPGQISEILVMISSLPDTKVEQYLNDLIVHSEEPFASALKSIDLKKEGIKTPEDLLMYLFRNKEKYPEEAVSKSIANLISARDINVEKIKSNIAPAGKGNLWILFVLLGVGLLALFLILWRRKRDQKK
jgi:hypothetical protein